HVALAPEATLEYFVVEHHREVATGRKRNPREARSEAMEGDSTRFDRLRFPLLRPAVPAAATEAHAVECGTEERIVVGIEGVPVHPRGGMHKWAVPPPAARQRLRQLLQLGLGRVIDRLGARARDETLQLLWRKGRLGDVNRQMHLADLPPR